jgi:hypothetical protein
LKIAQELSGAIAATVQGLPQTTRYAGNEHNISPEQLEAMMAGSVLGWHGNHTEPTVGSTK